MNPTPLSLGDGTTASLGEETLRENVPYGSPKVPSGSPMAGRGRPLWTVWDGVVLSGSALSALDADDTLARFVVERAGLELAEGKAQAWRLSDETISTMLERAEDGRYRAVLAGHETPAPLAVIFAAAVSGEFHWLSAAAFTRWKRRALLEAGLVGMPAVALADLPADISEATRFMWGAIELLVRVRVLGGERARDALPLSRPFMRRWAPLADRPTRTAMETLEGLEYIWRVGRYAKSGGRRPLTLWGVKLSEDA